MTQDHHQDILNGATAGYAAWYARLQSGQSAQPMPRALIDWMENAVKSVLLDQPALENLYALHRQLEENPAQNSAVFEDFITQLNQLERDSLLLSQGIDPVTGLRSADVMRAEIALELDRLERHGSEFALALVKIEHFETLKTASKTGQAVRPLRLIGRLIEKSLRSFDDAYRLPGGEFILCLKQTKAAGGVRALQRLKQELQTSSSSGELASVSDKEIKVSSCIAEPAPQENLERLFENLRADLTEYDDEHEGAILEYQELSPLQRYAKSQT